VHPDKLDKQVAQNGEAAEVGEAYQVLYDEDKRKEYDQKLQAARTPSYPFYAPNSGFVPFSSNGGFGSFPSQFPFPQGFGADIYSNVYTSTSPSSTSSNEKETLNKIEEMKKEIEKEKEKSRERERQQQRQAEERERKERMIATGKERDEQEQQQHQAYLQKAESTKNQMDNQIRLLQRQIAEQQNCNLSLQGQVSAADQKRNQLLQSINQMKEDIKRENTAKDTKISEMPQLVNDNHNLQNNLESLRAELLLLEEAREITLWVEVYEHQRCLCMKLIRLPKNSKYIQFLTTLEKCSKKEIKEIFTTGNRLAPPGVLGMRITSENEIKKLNDHDILHAVC